MSTKKGKVGTASKEVLPMVKVGDVRIYNVPSAAKKLVKKLGGVIGALVLIVASKGLFLVKLGAAKLSLLYLVGDNGLKSGRASGSVFMRNGRSRQFVVPRLVRNAYTAVVRANFSLFTGSFRGLTSAEIAAWNAYSGFASDRFGRTISVTGKQAYIRLNALLATLGIAPIGLPPTGAKNPQPTLNIEILTNTATALTVGFTNNTDGSGTQLWATPPLSAGVSRPGQSRFRLIGIIDTTAVGSANIYAAYVLKYGPPIVGAQIFIQYKVVNETTGLPSAITQSLGDVTT